MNVLEENFGSFYTGHQMKEAVGPGQIVCADHLDYPVPQLRRPQFRILLLCIFYALCHFVTKSYIHMSGNKHCTFYFDLRTYVSQEI